MCTMCRVSTVDINKVMKSCDAIYNFQPEKYITMDAEMTDMTWRHCTGDNWRASCHWMFRNVRHFRGKCDKENEVRHVNTWW